MMPSLYTTRSGTSSQCSSVWRSRDKPQSNFWVVLTTWAAAFNTRCTSWYAMYLYFVSHLFRKIFFLLKFFFLNLLHIKICKPSQLPVWCTVIMLGCLTNGRAGCCKLRFLKLYEMRCIRRLDILHVRWRTTIRRKVGRRAWFALIHFVLVLLIRSNKMLPKPKSRFMAGKTFVKHLAHHFV